MGGQIAVALDAEVGIVNQKIMLVETVKNKPISGRKALGVIFLIKRTCS